MTTGRVTITLGSYYIDGDFLLGKIQTGKISTKVIKGKNEYDNILAGTFVDDLLHGSKCSEIMFGYMFEGLFEYGKMKQVDQFNCITGVHVASGSFDNYSISTGTKYNYPARSNLDNKDIELDPDYETGIFQNDYLVDGSAKRGSKIYTGKFKHGNIESGAISYSKDITVTGTFAPVDRLLSGVIRWNNFTADVSIDPRNRLLTKCLIDTILPIESMSCEQIILFCCSGNNSELTHDFLNRYLKNYTVGALLMLNENTFQSLSVNDKIGLKVIIANLSLRNNCGTNFSDWPKAIYLGLFDNDRSDRHY